ncbi:hydrogen peroxide-inducible genes activator [Caenispirillum bisanense]|uniref:LysR family transcriptional regulator, hydrogen peroxide-inducible genes activator n=1 Tax=Caenispirillum bisanense TaxID=414052 RepID=A0A286G2U4_9PROT|nr:hydrogen peroxide-inducible genes activator [Caenispirillum bisanense]SOD89845.1 LysR family transcriptional regulator, hydrogen peroxide-inducible genes activator [Caenispirillum bisanense]
MKPLPTLRQLRYLVTVAETLHFGRAADSCLVTQSTLSAGIQELENLLRVRLLERRTKRQVVLTPLGEEIVARARRILADAEALVDAAAVAAEPLSGPLRLGVIPTIGPYVLPRALPAVRETYPDLKLFLREDQTARLLEQLSDGRLDVALLALPYATGDLETLPLWDEDVVVAAPADHPFAALDRVPEEALAGEDVLMLEDGHCLREHSLQACSLTRRPGANESFQATSLNTLVQMVGNGLGVTLLPRSAVPVEVGRGAPVVVRELEAARAARTVALCWRPGAARRRDFSLLAALLKRHAPEKAVLRPDR